MMFRGGSSKVSGLDERPLVAEYNLMPGERDQQQDRQGQTVKAIFSSRKSIFAFLEGANKNILFSASWWYWRANLVVVIFNCFAYALESNPSYVARPLSQSSLQQIHALLSIQIIFTLFQTVDFMCRVVFSPSWWRYILRPLRFFELLFFLAFYVHVILSLASESAADVGSDKFWALHAFAGLRLLGVTRVFRYFKGIKVIFAALRRKWFAFTLFIGVATICAFTFSAALFFVEKTGETYDNERQLWIRNVDKTISPFQSIYGTMWWGVATITTVGYGDHYPVTDAGKVVGAIACIIGVMLVSMPIGIFASAFSEIWTEYEKHKRRQWRSNLNDWRASRRSTIPVDKADSASNDRRSFDLEVAVAEEEPIVSLRDSQDPKRVTFSADTAKEASDDEETVQLSGPKRRKLSRMVADIRKHQKTLVEMMQAFNDYAEGYDEDKAEHFDSDSDVESAQ